MEAITMTPSAQDRRLSLRVSVTDRCQLRCRYCVPASGVAKRSRHEILTFEEILRFVQVLKTHFGLSKVHVTGGDPLERAGIVDFLGMLHAMDIPDMALTTNGQRLAERASDLKKAGLSRLNISLDTLKPDTFRRLTRVGELHRTLDGIEAAVEKGFSPIKLNMVVLRDVNEHEVIDIARFGLERGCQVRFLERMPIGPAASDLVGTFVSAAHVQRRLAMAFDLQPLPVRTGSSSRDVHARDHEGLEGILGFIAPYSTPFCDGCRRLRLTAAGRLIGCLARGEGPNIRDFLRNSGASDESQLLEAVHAAIRLKRTPGTGASEQDLQPFAGCDAMVGIGG